jgi:hypothetical protein
MKIQYIADDGMVFDTETDCSDYEFMAQPITTLTRGTEMTELVDFLRGQATWHESGICSKDPLVQEHVGKLRQWADTVEAQK